MARSELGREVTVDLEANAYLNENWCRPRHDHFLGALVARTQLMTADSAFTWFSGGGSRVSHHCAAVLARTNLSAHAPARA